MGPLTTEGDIYHAKHFVVVFSRRTKATKRKNQEISQYVDALTSFIQFDWKTKNLATISSSRVSIIELINSDKLEIVKKTHAITKAVDDWANQVIFLKGLSFIKNGLRNYDTLNQMISVHQVELQRARKETSGLTIALLEMQEVIKLPQSISISKHIVDNSGVDNVSIWTKMLQWKQYVTNELQLHLTTSVVQNTNLQQDLKCAFDTIGIDILRSDGKECWHCM